MIKSIRDDDQDQNQDSLMNMLFELSILFVVTIVTTTH